MDIGIGGPVLLVLSLLYLFEQAHELDKYNEIERKEREEHRKWEEGREEREKKEHEEFERRLQEASRITEERKKNGTYLGIWGSYGRY